MQSLIKRLVPALRRSPGTTSPPSAQTASASDPRPLLHPSSRRSVQKTAVVEPKTGPLAALKGRSVLVALDLENIDRSARDIGRVVDYACLARVLRAGIGRRAHLIAVFSCSDMETASERLLRAAGWATYTRPIETVRTRTGIVRHGNADVAFATAVGASVIALSAEVCALATGDGQLAIDVARCVKSIAPNCKMAVTLSLPGSTSYRLDARRSSVFAANLEIGDDVMSRMTHKTEARQAALRLLSPTSSTSDGMRPAII